jgi:hypothetical protein
MTQTRFAAESSIGLAAALAKLREGTSDEPAAAPDQDRTGKVIKGELAKMYQLMPTR